MMIITMNTIDLIRKIHAGADGTCYSSILRNWEEKTKYEQLEELMSMVSTWKRPLKYSYHTSKWEVYKILNEKKLFWRKDSINQMLLYYSSLSKT